MKKTIIFISASFLLTSCNKVDNTYTSKVSNFDSIRSLTQETSPRHHNVSIIDHNTIEDRMRLEEIITDNVTNGDIRQTSNVSQNISTTIEKDTLNTGANPFDYPKNKGLNDTIPSIDSKTSKKAESSSSKSNIDSDTKDVFSEDVKTLIINVIPMSSKTIIDPELPKGSQKVDNGQEGYTEQLVKNIFQNGVLISTEVVSETHVPMVPETLYIGSKESSQPYNHDLKNSKELLSLMNESRKKLNRDPLIWNDELHKAALVRAEELMDSFSHSRPNGEEFYTVNELVYGENIAWNYGTAVNFNQGWTKSQGHHENRTKQSWKIYGAAIIELSDGQTFGVELFGY